VWIGGWGNPEGVALLCNAIRGRTNAERLNKISIEIVKKPIATRGGGGAKKVWSPISYKVKNYSGPPAAKKEQRNSRGCTKKKKKPDWVREIRRYRFGGREDGLGLDHPIFELRKRNLIKAGAVSWNEIRSSQG